MNLLFRHAAAVGHDAEEGVVATIYVALHVANLLTVLLGKDEVRLVVAVLVGGDAIPRHAKLIGNQRAVVGNESEDADGARDGRRLGHDVVGRCADHIAARGCQSAHRHYDGLLLLQHLQCVPYLLRGNGAAARRVDTQHDGLHLLVVSQLLQVFYHRRANDGVLAHEAAGHLVDDFAVGIVDGNLLALLLLLRRQADHVGEHHLLHILILSDAQLALDERTDAVGVHVAVDEVRLHVVVHVGKDHDAVVGQLVQGFGRHAAAVGHIVEHVLPDALLVGRALFAVIVAHVLARHLLHGALIFAHAGSLILHAQLLVEPRQVVALAAQTLEVNHARFVEEHAVGHRCHVV